MDTSVWSLALRRPASQGSRETAELIELIREGRVTMIGAIRQEILSGIKAAEQYKKLRDRLRAFGDEALDAPDYEEAALCFNRCRAKGLQGSNTDFLICAVSMRRGLAILTTDKDFRGFAKVLGFELHTTR
ncbi:MAG TPA: PIN domain-containing protein [Polyangiaceae bacterium]|nr:PIN domain-containing protein [Polyangiaceae bacterium]